MGIAPVRQHLNNDQPSQRSRWARAVFLVAGLALVSAALLKGHQLATDPFSADPLLGKGLSGLAILGELALGLWLFSGVLPSLARLTALCCFGLFFAVSLTRAVDGEVSCACFGQIPVTPWLTAGFDLCVAVFLLAAGPPPSPAFGWLRAGVAGLVFATLAVPGVCFLFAASPAAQLTVTPALVDFGVLQQGQKGEGEIALFNPSARACTIASVTSSCPCLSVELPTSQVGSRQSSSGRVILDLSREPNFTGGLFVQVKGLTSEDQTAFQFAVRVLVKK